MADEETVPTPRPVLRWLREDHPRVFAYFQRRLHPEPSDLRHQYQLTRALFLRSMGVIYLIAFLSLWVQIDGLIGSDGILPIRHLLEAARAQNGGSARFFEFPTLCWFNASDGFLHFLCGGGVALSVLLIAGLAPAPILALLWLFYLSLVHAGQAFLGFQWDALLLEAGFLAIFFAPLQLRLRPTLFIGRKSPSPSARPSRIVLFLLRWLTFRLMFLSGLVKLLAHNPNAWTGFTAMRYHYETQPLPTWTSWYAHLAPNWAQSMSVGGVFFIELLVPVLFFGPRYFRLFACAMTVLFQLLIAATGNFGFFNLLAIVLCIPLLDDAILAKLRLFRETRAPKRAFTRWSVWVTAALAVTIVPLSLVPSLYRVRAADWIPGLWLQAYEAVAPFNIVNPYGLFEDMTTRRPELIVEGSNDGRNWLAYEFKWKPGRLDRRPQFCTPHMPRLDWQMWFAALGVYYEGQSPSWLGNFMLRLQQGSPAVLDLMEHNPFPDHPPKYVRVSLYDYRFTTADERAKTGDWWKRDLIDPAVLVAGPQTRGDLPR